jgi:phage terminase large subunit
MTPDELREFRRANIAKAREARKSGNTKKRRDEEAQRIKEEKRQKAEEERLLKPQKKVNYEVEATVEGLKPDTTRFKLSDKQIEAYEASEQFLLYGGAKGGGKSWFLCIWVFSKALAVPGNKIFFCRRQSVNFTNTTLETWKKCIPAKSYRIHEQKKKIYVYNGSVIDFGGLDDPLLIQSLNSAEYGNIAIDQAEEIDLDSFGMIRGTLRHKPSNGVIPDYHVRLSANPAQCWLKDKFILNPEPGFKYIQALPSDNPHLPIDYCKNLGEAFKHRPQLLSAYLHGSWDDLAGHDICIQPSAVDRAVQRNVNGRVLKRIIVNDPARYGDDENVIYVMEATSTCAYVLEEIILEHKSTMDTAGRLSALRKKHDAQIIAVDVIGIGSGIVDALYDLKEPVLAINSSAKPTVETEQKKYFNLRSQMWMEAGDKFNEGRVKLDQDYMLNGQLSSVKFSYKNGKLAAESKDDVKKRISRSPDRADAFIMGLYALDYVSSKEEEERKEVELDSQGLGKKISWNEVEDVNQEDYSGYNL